MMLPKVPRVDPLWQWVGLFIAVVVAAVLLHTAWLKHQSFEEQLASNEPVIARLLGLVEASPELLERLQALEAQLAPWVHPATEDTAQVANATVEKVRATVAAHGAEITSIQAKPAVDAEQFEVIAIDVQIQGDHINVQNSLLAMADLRPALLFRQVRVQAISAPAPGTLPRLGARVELFVLRSKPT